MRNLSYILMWYIIIVLMVYGQDIRVTAENQLTTQEQGSFYFPVFSPDGGSLLLTTGNYRGLWLLKMSDHNLQQLNDYMGAGYEPVFSADGKMIYFRQDRFDQGRKFSALIGQSVVTKEEIRIEPFTRGLSTPQLSKNDVLIYRKNEILTVWQEQGKPQGATIQAQEPVVYIRDTKIVLSDNGEERILSPAGAGHYVWPSLSPDRTKLLFTKTGTGTFISDLAGNIISELGYANAPKWSPDGKWIAYMVDRDDGYTFTASDLYITSMDGKTRFQVTNTDRIDLYPEWSPDGNEIVFATNEGQIYLLNLQITP
jgi:Tol biopolymer transport system component